VLTKLMEDTENESKYTWFRGQNSTGSSYTDDHFLSVINLRSSFTETSR
jgi:hypothetical protein